MVDLASFCWAIWKTRNDICFDRKRVRSPTEVVCTLSSFLLYWAGLQTIKQAALHFHPQEAPAEDIGMVLLQ
ncbi:hypothetical protein HU200_039996 [Digitaria exilis]|uniref:Uncharacterized protein n=1 Tax=Digitaria exilis TaxID=1010633 RepID=A0A835BA51_9POAL|nr:hypothetical protein HU200_039996 [Digitaria exilis]